MMSIDGVTGLLSTKKRSMIDVAVDALILGRERPTRTRMITGLNLT